MGRAWLFILINAFYFSFELSSFHYHNKHRIDNPNQSDYKPLNSELSSRYILRNSIRKFKLTDAVDVIQTTRDLLMK